METTLAIEQPIDEVKSIFQSYEDLGLYNDDDIFKIITVPRINLGNWPTPLMNYAGIDNFSIKRDDLSGFGRGGIKTRKLEAILACIRNKKIKNLIILVPNISNLRADLELYTQTHEKDLSLNLFISNVPGISKELRQELIPRKHNYVLVGKSKVLIAIKMISKWISLRKKKPMFVLPSLMHPAAVIGAANGLIELYAQCKQTGRPLPRHIFVSACTGSSGAGLILASEILRKKELADITINIVRVFEGPLKIWIWFMLYWTKIVFRLKVNVPASSIIIHSKHADVPYGSNNSELNLICKTVREEFNINIDPIYGARTWSVMTDFLNDQYKGDEVMYWHCGYTPDWKY